MHMLNNWNNWNYTSWIQKARMFVPWPLFVSAARQTGRSALAEALNLHLRSSRKSSSPSIDCRRSEAMSCSGPKLLKLFSLKPKNLAQEKKASPKNQLPKVILEKKKLKLACSQAAANDPRMLRSGLMNLSRHETKSLVTRYEGAIAEQRCAVKAFMKQDLPEKMQLQVSLRL